MLKSLEMELEKKLKKIHGEVSSWGDSSMHSVLRHCGRKVAFSRSEDTSLSISVELQTEDGGRGGLTSPFV